MVDKGLGPDGLDRDGLGPDNAPAADDAALVVAARHALHDEELVVALATGSLDDAGKIERARSFVDRCVACRDLHHDIAAIGSALRMDALGAMVAPRDFRLTVEDARRLGGPVSVGGFVATFRRTIVSLGRPVGASMAALGIVGLLVGSVALIGGAALAPIGADTGAAASLAPAEIQSGLEGTGGPKSSDRVAVGPESSTGTTTGETDTPRYSAALNADPVVLLLAGSGALLVAGLLLLVIAFRRGRGNRPRARNS